MAMSPEEIKRALGYGGSAEIAQRTNRTRPHVHFVIKGERRDRKVEVAISRCIGRPVDEVFQPVEKQSAVIA